MAEDKGFVQTDNGKMRKIKPQSMEASMKEENDDYAYPHLCLKNDQLPEMKDWKVGEKYEVDLEVELESISKNGGTLIVRAVKAS